MRKFLLKPMLFCLVLAAAVSCDKDFNDIGTNIVGDDHFLGDQYSGMVSAYTQAIGPVQTSKGGSATEGVSPNTLGYYNNPVFGSTTASFVTQLGLPASTTFGDSPHVKKVMLTVPYYATLTATDDDGNHSYTLDSILGKENKIKLDVYASNYYLRDYDPATELQQPQRYYSDQSDLFDNNIDPAHPQRLNDSTAVSQNDAFFFDNREVVTYKTGDDGLQQVDTRTAPEMNLSLNRQFFQDKIFGSGASGQLSSASAFNNYFRGLYFKVSPSASSPLQGSLAQLNLGKGKITITYSVIKKDSNGQPVMGTDGQPEREDKTFVLSLTGKTVNLLQQQDSTLYSNGLSVANAVTGDERLYLKGGQGSMAVIDLFGPDSDGNNVPDELEYIRAQGWLINDAVLSVYVDTDIQSPAMSGADAKYLEPIRLYLYNLKSRKPIVDYYDDVTTNSGHPKLNKYIHGGILEKNTDGHRYRFRITDHVRNLVEKDSVNARLGLTVTETIANTGNSYLKTPGAVIDRVPTASVDNRIGTILYGTNVPASEADKRVKLTIYYTKKKTD